MNKQQTNRIQNGIKRILLKYKYPITDINNNGDILHFISYEHGMNLGEYRNSQNDRVRLLTSEALIHFKAGVNPAGIGDGQNPDKAITYTIGCGITANKIPFQCSRGFDFAHSRFYGYDRTLSGILERFENHISQLRAVS